MSRAAVARTSHAPESKTAKTPSKLSRKPAPRPVLVPRGPEHSLDQVTVLPVERIKLPFQAALEQRFDRPLDSLVVMSGAPVAEWLAESDAEAAATGNVIWLASPMAPIDTVAHEVVHALQSQAPVVAAVADVGLAPDAGAAAEAEASALADGALAHSVSPVQAAPPVQEVLPSGVVAFRRSHIPATPSPATPTDADLFARERDRTPAPVEPEREDAAAPAAPESAEPPSKRTAEPGAAEAKLPSEAPEPTFALPPMPETTLTPEEQAARKTELEAAQQAIAQATDAKGVVGAYADAPPTVKAATQSTIGGRITDVVQTDQQKFDSNLPGFHATLTGAELPDESAPVAAPDPAAYAFDPDHPRPAPEVTVPRQPPPERYTENDELVALLLRMFGFGAAAAIAKALGRTVTSDPGVDTYPGEKLRVPLEGDTDPAEMARQKQKGEVKARAARDDATQAVIDGRGPMVVQLRAMDDLRPVDELAVPQPEALTGAPEAERLNQMALPEEVLAQFDQDMGATMQASLEEARTQVGTAEQDRDVQRDAAVRKAEDDRARLARGADEQQRTHVTTARTTIQDERKTAIDGQHKAVADLERDAEKKRIDAETGIDTTIAANETLVSTTYDQAEVDAKKKVEKGEEDAEAKRLKAERDAEEESWWDRAVGFVSDLFDKLTSLINDIFDAVREAVGALFDAVRKLAKGLIDAVAGLVKAAITAFGQVLTTLVDLTIGQVFPELAKDLNDGINGAVATANSAVDSVANTLKAGVDAVVDVLEKAVNAVINTFQAAVNTAIGFMQAAITGDWGKFALRVLESVLRILGIDRDEFYGFIANIMDTVDLIIDDPLGFVSHLIDTVVLGIQKFADHFETHLRAGVIAWLTGALGDIQIPSEFSIAGVLDIARQVLGLTWDWLRKKAVDLVGEKNVARVEFILSYVETLVDGGFGALWERITSDLGNLVDNVLGRIKEYLLTEVVLAGIKWIAALFTPVGALVKLVFTAWNLYTFVRDQLQRIVEVVRTVVSALADLAHGLIEGAALRIETALASLLPVALDMLAKLLDIGGIAGAVRRIITDIRATINRAVDALLQRVLKAFGKGEGPAVASADGAAGDAVSEPLAVDVEQGADHVLSIVAVGSEAAVMLASDPLPVATWLDKLDADVPTLESKADQKEATKKIAKARKLLAKVAPEAKAVVAARAGGGKKKKDKTLESDKVKLRDALVAAFDAFPNKDGAAIVNVFAAKIERAHEDAQPEIKKILEENQLKFQTLRWPAIRDEITKKYNPFHAPMLQEHPFGLKVHAEARKQIPADAPPDSEARLLSAWVTRLVNNDTEKAVFVNARVALQEVLFEHQNLSHASVSLGAAVKEALVLMTASGEKADPRLVKAASGNIIGFLLDLATGEEFSFGLNISKFEQEYWNDKTPNQKWIKERFRGPGGKHEWIPTNYVMLVVQRAKEARDIDGIEAAAAWVTFQDALRSPTEILIFPPAGRYERKVTHPRDPVSRARLSGGERAVLQGHVGAVYAPVRKDGYSEDVIAQVQGQDVWHEDLREIFTDHPGTDFDAMKSIVKGMKKFIKTDVWDGVKPAAPVFNEYYTTIKEIADGDGAVSTAVLRDRAKGANATILKNFVQAEHAAGDVFEKGR